MADLPLLSFPSISAGPPFTTLSITIWLEPPLMSWEDSFRSTMFIPSPLLASFRSRTSSSCCCCCWSHELCWSNTKERSHQHLPKRIQKNTCWRLERCFLFSIGHWLSVLILWQWRGRSKATNTHTWCCFRHSPFSWGRWPRDASWKLWYLMLKCNR